MGAQPFPNIWGKSTLTGPSTLASKQSELKYASTWDKPFKCLYRKTNNLTYTYIYIYTHTCIYTCM